MQEGVIVSGWQLVKERIFAHAKALLSRSIAESSVSPPTQHFVRLIDTLRGDLSLLMESWAVGEVIRMTESNEADVGATNRLRGGFCIDSENVVCRGTGVTPFRIAQDPFGRSFKHDHSAFVVVRRACAARSGRALPCLHHGCFTIRGAD
jgi:hypothetical protein